MGYIMSYQINSNCINCSACVKVCPVDAIYYNETDDIHIIKKELCIECGACGLVCPKSSVVKPNGEIAIRVLRKEWKKPKFDLKVCISCSACVQKCYSGALEMSLDIKTKWGDAPILVNPKKCIDCRWCEEICPVDAIVME